MFECEKSNGENCKLLQVKLPDQHVSLIYITFFTYCFHNDTSVLSEKNGQVKEPLHTQITK